MRSVCVPLHVCAPLCACVCLCHGAHVNTERQPDGIGSLSVMWFLRLQTEVIGFVQELLLGEPPLGSLKTCDGVTS